MAASTEFIWNEKTILNVSIMELFQIKIIKFGIQAYIEIVGIQ